jgi:uncharacterized membrane protein YadS
MSALNEAEGIDLTYGSVRSVSTVGTAVCSVCLGGIAFVIDLLTVNSMAALGLGTDLRNVMRAGARVPLLSPRPRCCWAGSTLVSFNY